VNEALRDELIVLVESGWPVIALETFEESRALEVIEAAATALRRELRTWTAASGLSHGALTGPIPANTRIVAASVTSAAMLISFPTR